MFGPDAPVRVKIGDEPTKTLTRTEFDAIMMSCQPIVDPLDALLDQVGSGEPLTPAQERLLQAEFESRPCDEDDEWDPDALELSRRAGDELTLAIRLFPTAAAR